MIRVATALACGALVVGLTGCGRPDLVQGESCEQNSDCATPLICELGRCRRQCVDSRDCPAGTMCLNVGERGGACQVPDEARCLMNSDCRSPLVCLMETCTTECVEDRDCIGDATCEGPAGEGACIDSAGECIYHSDCPDPLDVCVVGQRCQRECMEERDCVAPRVCDDMGSFRCVLPDGGM